jgi:DMSO/TMAO reductase YedYZ molybdopterin-dependent catalytic subunit
MWRKDVRSKRAPLAEGGVNMIEEISLGDGKVLHPITNIEDFFILSHYKGSTIDVNKWVLKVGGSVHKPVECSYEELMGSYPRVSEVITMECVINPVGGRLVGTAVWSGVPLRDVLAEVEVKDEAVDLFCKSEDGVNRGFPLGFFQNPLTLLAYEMNGQRLPVEYGFPLRLVVPGYYGFVWRKWLKELILKEEKYADPQWVASMKLIKSEKVVLTTKILTPHDHEVLTRTPYVIAGVSWGGEKPIRRVEVSFDKGLTWEPAEIIWRPPHPYAWVVWRLLWVPPAEGPCVVTVRAINEGGSVQIDGNDAYPSGLGRLHRVNVVVSSEPAKVV